MAIKTRQIFRPTDEAGVQRQMLLAQAMQEQALSGAPRDWDRMRVVPKYGAGHAIAQLAQAMGGAYLQRQANEGQKDIDAAKRKRLAEAMGIDSMTKGYDTPDDGVGPVRDPNTRAQAESRQQALRTINEIVPIDQQEQLVGSLAVQKAFPAPPKKFTGTRKQDEDLYVDGELIAAGNRPPPDSRTDDQREYEFAVSQGYPGSFQEWQLAMRRAGASQTNINLPKEPEGFYRPDPDKPGLAPEPGGPEDIKLKEAKSKATGAFNASMTGLQRTYDTIEKLEKGNVEGITGWQSIFPNWPGGEAANAEAFLETLLAQSGFKELADMRAASPTGGALGSITERELSLLQNAATALHKSQNPKQFRENLSFFKQQLRDSAIRLHQAYQQDFGSSYQQQRPQIDSTTRPPPRSSRLDVHARSEKYFE